MRLPFVRPAGLWRHTDFLRLWAAQTISLFGSEITFLAVPFIAANSLHASPPQMGALAFLAFLPYLLLGLVAGVWIDRFPRRTIMITADLGRAVLIGSIPVMAFIGILGMPQLYTISFLSGCLGLFFAAPVKPICRYSLHATS